MAQSLHGTSSWHRAHAAKNIQHATKNHSRRPSHDPHELVALQVQLRQQHQHRADGSQLVDRALVIKPSRGKYWLLSRLLVGGWRVGGARGRGKEWGGEATGERWAKGRWELKPCFFSRHRMRHATPMFLLFLTCGQAFIHKCLPKLSLRPVTTSAVLGFFPGRPPTRSCGSQIFVYST